MQRNSIINDVLKVVIKIDKWITHHNWTGYDPYDIRGQKLYVHLTQYKSIYGKLIYKIFDYSIERLPIIMRKVFNIKPEINAKAMGLFLTAYSNLYHINKNNEYLEKADHCAKWLLSNTSPGYSEYCWGYPFDWQSKIFIPRETPSSVVTAVIGDGFWQLAKITKQEKYFDVCKSICDFFLNDLNIHDLSEQIICFSYTPLDDFHVHNANLFVAEFLARVGKKYKIREYLHTAILAGNYALSEQRGDGSLNYWGNIQNHYNLNHRDCYHSGFEIRALWGLWKSTGDERFYDAAKNYLEFFYDTYIKDNGEIWLSPEMQYPINIHACAESILCPAVLAELDRERFNANWYKVYKWILEMIYNSDGSFGYKIFSNGRIDRTPYIRWGQAWMFLALSELIKTLMDNKSA